MSVLAWTLLLASARLFALLRVQAAARMLVGARWELIAAALALVLAGLAVLAGVRAEPAPGEPLDLLLLVLVELMSGTLIGMLASLPGWALCGAATQSEQVLCGESEGEAGSLSLLLVAGSLACGLSLGLHRPLLTAAIDGLSSLPLGDPLAWPDAARLALTALPQLLVHATTLALALATPVLLTRLVVTIGVASLGRDSDFDAMLLAAWVPGLRFAAALLALGAAWTAYPHAWAAGLGVAELSG